MMAISEKNFEVRGISDFSKNVADKRKEPCDVRRDYTTF
jgi:hypothetical protein